MAMNCKMNESVFKAGVSNTRPAGHMRPANIRKNEDFKGNNELFFQIN